MITKKIQKFANSFARKHGHGRATSVKIGGQTRIIATIPYGYRKYTTGEYVPNSYRANFGWKNTYYQHAICHVQISWEDWFKISTNLIPAKFF